MSEILMHCSTLRKALDLTVPAGILDLQRKGGPNHQDRKWLQGKALDRLMVEADAFVDDVAKGKGDSRRNILGALCRAVSIMAFCPGGVEVFGVTYEANPLEAIRSDEQASANAQGGSKP